MMKKVRYCISRFLLTVIGLLFLSIVDIDAHEIKIKSFSIQMEPMTVPMQRKDNNGAVCALIKVFVPNDIASFEGSLIGNCDYKTSEYWCYLSPGSKHIKIKYPNCEPLLINFVDFIGSGVKEAQVYELHLEFPTIVYSQNQKVYSLAFTVHSSKTTSLLGKRIYEHMDSVTIHRFNMLGECLDSSIYNQGELNSISGEYKFNVGAIEGDRFEITANGYLKRVVVFQNTQQTQYEVTLEPKK
jgi:hypothetical protein